MPNRTSTISITRLLLGVVLLMIYIGSASLVYAQIKMPIIQKLSDPLNQLGNSFQVVINPMVEDSLGYIWIGSKNGLCKYSGSSIECY